MGDVLTLALLLGAGGYFGFRLAKKRKKKTLIFVIVIVCLFAIQPTIRLGSDLYIRHSCTKLVEKLADRAGLKDYQIEMSLWKYEYSTPIYFINIVSKEIASSNDPQWSSLIESLNSIRMTDPNAVVLPKVNGEIAVPPPHRPDYTSYHGMNGMDKYTCVNCGKEVYIFRENKPIPDRCPSCGAIWKD